MVSGDDAGIPDERFKKHRVADRVDSSAEYSIRLRRDAIDYTDHLGTLAIDAEWAPGRGTWILVFAASLPDTADRPHQGVLDNLQRAFSAAGWRLSLR